MDIITPLLVLPHEAVLAAELENIWNFEKRGFERRLLGFEFSKTEEIHEKQISITIGIIINLQFLLGSIHI
jgi:hypothetical protein